MSLGGVMSGPADEMFVTAALTSDTESLPDASCTAKFDARESGVGAV